MRKFGQALVQFLKNEDGPTAVEYAVMLALIIVVCITAITTLGTNANATFSAGRRPGRQDRQLSWNLTTLSPRDFPTVNLLAIGVQPDA